MPRPPPPTSIVLDTEHPLAPKCVGIWYNAGSNTMVDAKAGLTLTANGAGASGTNAFGLMGNTVAVDAGFQATATATQKVTEGTVATYCIPKGHGVAYDSVFGIDFNAAGDNPYVALNIGRDGGGAGGLLGAFNLGGIDGSGYQTLATDWASLYSTDVTAILSVTNGAQAFYINGDEVASSAIEVEDEELQSIAYGSGASVAIGTRTNEPGRNSNIETMVTALFSPPLNEEEAEGWDADPWALLRGEDGSGESGSGSGLTFAAVDPSVPYHLVLQLTRHQCR